MRRVVLWVLGLSALIACLAATNLHRDPRPVEVDWQLFRPSPPAITVGAPTRGPIARTVAAKGVVEPIRQVQVVAKVSGKVAEVRVEEGSLVLAGTILVKLDDAPFRTRAEAATTRLDTATTNLAKAEAHLRDIEKDPGAATAPATPAAAGPLANFPGAPAAAPVIGPTKLETARNSVDGWKRERKSAEAAERSARTDLDHTAVRASIAGVVEELAVEVGDDVVASPTLRSGPTEALAGPAGMMAGFGPGGEARPEPLPAAARGLCTIFDPDQLRVRAWVDEADVGLVAADQPARIFLPDEPTTAVAGRISKVAPRGRPTGEVVAYAATIRFDAAGKRPKAGMRVNVEVEVSREESLLGVPVQAVLHRKRRDLGGSVAERRGGDPAGNPRESGVEADYVKAVFVLDGTQARLRVIETGLSDERRVEVVSGLASDESIVVGPFRALDTLEDGMVVRRETPPAEVPLSLSQRPGDLARRPTR